MSLTSELKDPKSNISDWFDQRLLPKTHAFLSWVNTQLGKRKIIYPPQVQRKYEYALVGTAFDYAFRLYWASKSHHLKHEYITLPEHLVALKGAPTEHHADMVKSMIDMAFMSPDLIPEISIALAWYEQNYRSRYFDNRIGGTVNATLDAVPEEEATDVKKLLDTAKPKWSWFWGSRDMVSNPIPSESYLVGGADGDWMVGSTLYECKTSVKRGPMNWNHFCQALGYLLMERGREINYVAWYFPRQQHTVVKIPVSGLMERFWKFKTLEEAQDDFLDAAITTYQKNYIGRNRVIDHMLEEMDDNWMLQ